MEQPSTILAVDDNPINLRLLTAILGSDGYEVLLANSGMEALERIALYAPDLVLLDVVMPHIDGYEVCRRVRAEPTTRFLPIIMITAFEEQERLNALEAGADDFVHRPIKRAELLTRVRSLVRLKHYQDQIERQAEQLRQMNDSLEQRVADQVEQIERLSRLRRFLAPQVAELVIASREAAVLHSHRREIGVVCCGLAGFSEVAEVAEPEVVLGVLQEMYTVLGEIAHEFEGTVGDFTEAGLLVLFNDPLPTPAPALQAARMALKMRERMRPVASRWRRRGLRLDFRAGIDLGFASLGRIGFAGREDYAAVGRVVRVAARLYERAQADQILASERVSAEITDGIVSGPQVALELDGLPTPVLASALEGERVAPRPELSAREQEVATLVARGMTNRQIAEHLVVSERTVETHLERIFAKLDLHARAQLASWASAHGLVLASPS
ncbi:MAG TPA: response regulator [Chloroflexota bacterium]